MGCGSSRVTTPPQHTREPSTYNFNKEQTKQQVLPPKTENPIQKVPSVKKTEPEVHLETPVETTTAPAEPTTAASDAFVSEVQEPSPPDTITRASTPPVITRIDPQKSFGNEDIEEIAAYLKEAEEELVEATKELQNSKAPFDEEVPTAVLELKQCPTCGRKFRADRLEKHSAACTKVSTMKREKYNLAEKRKTDLIRTNTHPSGTPIAVRKPKRSPSTENFLQQDEEELEDDEKFEEPSIADE